ncbi:Zn-dependent exopeptidase [Coemansia reversa NRRL 1564]|uniref:Peptide hydrolase n=1 Tax=Coemansia reversa (strain ATCC 12441 / NRRL 1564) TaxID=763665 RepID=A0A2G5B7V5_COERN|nr:Zn-dependent exopeptidase [Coemansia reversa NRRL 1564]|eukprot:PIA14807.1 Zn-dependent exopeptidase [Coemansia reversa NRRL 1564]
MQPGKLYNEQRLIKVSESSRPRWMDLESIMVLRRAGVRFMDITDVQELHRPYDSITDLTKEEGHLEYKSKLPQELLQGKNVAKAVSLLSTELYGKVLEPFTAFHNRYYDSENGRKSSEWLQEQVEQLVTDANVTVTAFKHRFPQSSIVARIEGRDAKEETVVISAHQDSVNQWIPWFGRASGADDDGSGTVTILEALRVLLKNGFKPNRSVEFHWYAGEEGGLLGSQDVALAYKNDGRKVAANMHFDMTGFWLKESKEVIGLVADRTDAETRNMVKSLAEEYTQLRTKEFLCGYGCSDHASWNSAGYRSAMAFESDKLDANTYIHSPSDTVETLDFDHMLEFSKLAVAFAYEVGYIADDA